MSNGYFKAAIPHVIAGVLFLILSVAYYLPAIQGKVLNQSDNIQALGMQKEINDIREKGEHPLWTNSMFGGMPVYQIHLPQGNNFTSYFNKVFMLGGTVSSPHMSMFLLMMMFYVMMVAMGVDWRLSAIGAVAYGLATNHVVLTEAGHSTKVITMAYLPPMLAGIWLTFRGKYLAGGVMTALFFALQLLANHVQITFYFFLTLALLGLFEGYKALKANALPSFAKAVGVLVLAGVVGLGANVARIWTTYEYTDETIRGKSEITKAGPFTQNSSSNKETGDGLSNDYIFGWSYGIGETFTILIPDFMGRASGSLIGDKYGQLRDDTETAKYYKTQLGAEIQRQAGANGQQVQQELQRAANPYRGDVQFTSGPIYFGAIICFLFLLGFFLVPGNIKWWFLSSTILMAMLAWGRHFPALNYFLVEHAPMFNKFRAVMMALGIGQLFVTAFGVLALKELFFNREITAEVKAKSILIAAGATAGLSLLLYLAAMMGMIDFASPKDNAELLANYQGYWNAIQADRASMLQSDALRSFMFIALAGGALWAYATNKLNWKIAMAIVGLLVVVDFWGVDQRFVAHDDFQTKKDVQKVVAKNQADEQILADPDPHFRVADYSRGFPYTSAQASYYHKSIGGYHAAKLMRFQDLCEYYLFGQNPTEYQHLLGMMNVKYFIYGQGDQPPVKVNNPAALGNAWFVQNYELVENADAEIAGLKTLEPRTKALVEKKFAGYLQGLKIDSLIPGDYIKLTNYHPDRMEYEVKSQKEQLAVFSEIYYPPGKGWNLYIDGKKQDLAFIKANYVLRAARIPAGEYKIEMKFEPKSYYTGRQIALVCSLIIIGGFGFMLYKNYTNYTPPVESLPVEAPKPPQQPKRSAPKAAEQAENKERRRATPAPAPKKRRK
jgi:hypothetical protein